MAYVLLEKQRMPIYVVRNGETGPVVVLLHEWAFTHGMFGAWVPPLLEAGYQLIRLDLPGHGLSSDPLQREYTLEDFAEWVGEVLRLKGCQRVHLVGIGLGGMVALRLALRHPKMVASLGLLATSAQAEPPAKRWVYLELANKVRSAWEDTIGGAERAKLVDQLVSYNFAQVALPYVGQWRGYLVDSLHGSMFCEALSKVAWATFQRNGLTAEELWTISVPVYVARGGADRFRDFEESQFIAENTSAGAVDEYPGLGHMFILEDPPGTIAPLVAFLCGVPGGGL